jgi:nitrite reductase (NADH) large subunit
MTTEPATRFPPYTQIPSSVTPRTWQLARIAVLALTLATAAFMLIDRARGLMTFWQLLVPALPMLFAVAPGLWRQICPMAFLNQLPVEKGWSRGAGLPPALMEHAYLIAVVLFAGAIILRRPLFIDNAAATSVLILLALAAAFAGGLVFKGRSGWCGTFCPLAPLQKIYGHAPPVVVPNGYCPTCVGCQRNCYDFNPTAALHADMTELPARFAEHRSFFSALLPGLVLAAWLADPYGQHGIVRYLAECAGYILASLGVFYAVKNFLPLSAYRMTALFGMAGFVLFYWHEAAPMTGAISALTGLQLPYPAASYVIVLAALAVAAKVLWTGFDNEAAYASERQAMSHTSFGVEPVALAEGRRVAALEAIRDRASGRSFGIDPEHTLLEIFEGGGLMVAYGCRSGVCGADPVAIVGGQENLSAAGPAEQETLRRLGLEGRARMACVCRARGPVEVDLKADLQALSWSSSQQSGSTDAPSTDLAVQAGIGRVVIIGNGVAGTTAAELLRRDSPSCRIDLITRESQHFYNRMALGRVVSSRSGLDGLQLMPAAWFEQRRITVWLNTIANHIDPVRREVHLGTGETLVYDRLILAPGGAAIVPDVPGVRLPGVFVLREAEDAVHLRKWSQMGRHAVSNSGVGSAVTRHREAVVVGGGVLGVEAASALVDLGLRVTIVHKGDRLMNRQLDAKAAGILERFLVGKGVEVLTRAHIDSLHGHEELQSVRLADGTVIDAQMCVFCVGVQSNISLASAAGLKTNAGIIVDELMRTSQPDIFAIGDAAELVNSGTGLWTLGAEHAERAVACMLNRPPVLAVAPHTLHLKISGIDIRAFGQINARGARQIEHIDPNEGEYDHRKLVLEDGRVVGAVFAGPPGSAKTFAAVVSGTAGNIPFGPARDTPQT